jgi:hypothetical protein
MQIKFHVFNYYFYFIVKKSSRRKSVAAKKPKHEYIKRLSNYQRQRQLIQELREFVNSNENSSRNNHGVY